MSAAPSLAASAAAALPAKPGRGAAHVRELIWPLMRPYRGALFLGLALNALHGIALSYQPMMLPWLIRILGGDDPPALFAWAAGGGQHRWAMALWLAAFYLVISIVGRMVAWHLGYRAFTWVRERAVFALRAMFFRHVNHLCLRFHGQHPSGELFSYLFGSPLAQVVGFYQHVSINLVGSITSVITALLLLGMLDLPLTGVMLGMAIANVLIMRSAHSRMHQIHRDYQTAEGDVSGRIADLLRGNRAIKLYAMENRIAADFDTQVDVLGRKSQERDVRTHMQHMKQETCNYVAYAALIAVGAWRWLDGSLGDQNTAVATLTAYFFFYGTLLGPLQAIFSAAALAGSAQASIERIGTVLATASTTPDPQGPPAPMPHAGAIELANLTFAYEDGAAPALRDVSLTIPYGQRVALVGPSGAGKSTVSQLLMRLYDPQLGSVRYAGVDLRELSGPELRRRFGVVPQDPFIFRTSIRDNLRVARPDADDAAIRRACELANAWEFIGALPDGLDTRVGEGGSTLSGGQRQRLAIARVLLADPPCFIFDEATSALDTLSEQLIQDALEKNVGGRTAIFIAHRLATVKNCDRIVVIAAGRVIQDGTYDELALQPGMFRDLVLGQQLRH